MLEEYAEINEFFVVADLENHVYIRDGKYPAESGHGDLARSRQLVHHFGVLWEKSEPIGEMFTLGL